MHWIYTTLVAFCLVAGAESKAGSSDSVETNEVTVQTAATGVSIFPADKATSTVSFSKPGANNKEARANVRALAEQFIRELTALGVPRSDIELQEPANRMGFVGNEEVQGDVRTVGDAVAVLNRPKMATASLVVTISDLRMLPELNRYIDEKNAVVMESPAYSLRDERRARDTAIADGIAKARADADAYAAALGMRVSRVISANDQSAQNVFSFPGYDEMLERFTGRTDVKIGMVKTSMRVVVRFGLVPR